MTINKAHGRPETQTVLGLVSCDYTSSSEGQKSFHTHHNKNHKVLKVFSRFYNLMFVGAAHHLTLFFFCLLFKAERLQLVV